jgi:hypothetical protein
MSARAAVESSVAMNETKTFRGRSLEEVLPLIKADLGPDAEIVRQREGLTGGVGGFFQRACVEIDARPSEAPSIDIYEDEPAVPDSFEADPLPEPQESITEGLAAPGIQEILRQASPFADHLSEALEPPARVATRPQIADAIEQQLVEAGIAAELASEIVAETVSHLLPFASQRRLRKLIRKELARRIAIAPTPSAGGRSLAFVGPAGSGKTLCAAQVASAYATGGDLPVVCVALQPKDDGRELKSLVEPHGVGVTIAQSAGEARAHIAGALQHAVIVVDTPSGISTEELQTLGVTEVHLTLPSLYSAAAACELTDRFPATCVALTHLDESPRIGPLLGELPISFVSKGAGGLEPADAHDIASLVLP